MEGRWPRALLIPLTILAWLAVLVVLGWLLGHVARTVLMVVLALVIAFAVTPAVNLFGRALPRMAALALTYLLAFLLIVALVVVLVASVAGEVSNLVHSLPAYAQQAQASQPEIERLLAPLGIDGDAVDSFRDQLVTRLEETGGRAASDVVGFVRAFLGALLDSLLVLMLSVYFVANGPRVRAWLHEQTPPRHRFRTRVLTGIVNQVVGGYVRGTLTLALLIGSLVGAGMAALHVRYALLLGVLAFFMAFIPILGTFVSGTVCVLVALLQGWVLALVVLVYFVVVHIIEGDVIGPRIMGQAVGIHPAVALIALLAGTELFGLWGALFGAPLAGLIQSIVQAAWREVRAGAAEIAAGASPARDPSPASISRSAGEKGRRSR